MPRRSVQKLNQLLLGVAEIAHRLTSGDALAQLPEVVRILGQGLGVDRVYLNQYHPGEGGEVRVSQRAEWTSDKVAPLQHNPAMQNRLPYEPFRQRLLAGEILMLHRQDIPAPFRRHPALADIGSFLEVPIFAGEALWGFIGFNSVRRRRTWDEAEVSVLRTAADSLGKALWREQAQQQLRQEQNRSRELLLQSRRNNERLELLLKLARTLKSDLDLPDLYRQVVETVAQTFGYELFSIYLWEDGELVMQHQVGYEFWLERIPAGEGVMYQCFTRGQPIWLADAQDDPRFIGMQPDIRSEIAVPLRAGGRVVGVINAESMTVTYTEHDLEFLVAVADQISVALERSSAYNALREQEALHRLVLDNQSECVSLFDGDTLIYTNPASLRAVGAEHLEEVVGRSLGGVSAGGRTPLDLRKYAQALREGRSVTLTEASFRNLRGEAVEIEITLSPVQMAGRRLTLATWRDIRERKRAEAALRQSQERFRALVETSPDGILELDPDGQILYANAAFAWLVGASGPAEVQGQNISRFRPADVHAPAQPAPEAHHPFQAAFSEQKYARVDGQRVAVEVGRAQIPGHNRSMQIVRDISARQAAEAAVRESENRFRTVVEVSPDGVLLIEPEFGRILYANPAYLQMVRAGQAEQVVGQLLWRFVHPDYQNLVAGRVMQIAQNGEAQPLVEQRHLRLDGSVLEVEVASSGLQVGSIGAILIIVRDVGQRKRAEDALKASEARFKALIQNSLDMTLIVDQKGLITYATPNAVRIPPEAVGKISAFDFLPGEEQERARGILAESLRKPREIITLEINATLPGNEPSWYDVWVQNLLDEPAVGGIVLNLRDISERKAYQSTIEYLAYHDAMTGLPNRRMLREQSDQVLAQAKRNAHEATLVYLDLDRFKEVNDTLGHEAGDALLVQVARRIQGCIRQGDLLARLGGDEFAILLHDTTPTGAADAAQRVLAVLAQPFTIADTTLRIGASLGLGVFPRDGLGLDELMRAADVAMYQAKEKSVGFAFYSPELDRYSRERLELLHDLREALEEGQFVLEYQPILDTHTGQYIKAEALVRWQHPLRGRLSPAVFIPLAEETGLIRALDRWVLGRACLEASQLGLPVAANVSALTLYDPGFVEMVRDALEGGNLRAQELHLELTETALIQDLPRAIRHLTALRELGVKIALDDFGVGNSSMGYLKQLPVDVLKIDRSFVWGIGKDAREEAILRTILALGEGLGIHTVAEGVETAEQIDWLSQKGCHLLQGYAIARPQPKEKLRKPIEA
ncbi:MAG: EAL domain-containing protein [Meiothermus sp.]|nr:EAL domain-containing protein [Meiothermus sp.]